MEPALFFSLKSRYHTKIKGDILYNIIEKNHQAYQDLVAHQIWGKALNNVSSVYNPSSCANLSLSS